jgi:hypothetical protein
MAPIETDKLLQSVSSIPEPEEVTTAPETLPVSLNSEAEDKNKDDPQNLDSKKFQDILNTLDKGLEP